jgi:hypothetical protein
VADPTISGGSERQLTFTVPATLDSAERVSHAVMQWLREKGKSAADELQAGSDVFQRFSAYVMDRTGRSTRVQCQISCNPEGGIDVALSDAA